MARSRLITIRGPWRGMEERDSLRAPEQCAIAQNVIFCDGTIQPRKGFKRYFATGQRSQVYPVQVDGKLRYVLATGPLSQATNHSVGIHVLESDGETFENLKFGYSGTATQPSPIGAFPSIDYRDSGTVATNEFQCSFLRMPLALEESISGYKLIGHQVVFICTKVGVYFFDIDDPARGIQEVSISDHAVLDDAANEAYFENSPKANIAIEYRNAVVYAGFSRGTQVPLTNPVPSDQNYVPEHLLDHLDNATMSMEPNWFAISNPWAPLSIKAMRTYNVDGHETITGLAEFMESLIVFTDENIWIGNGFGGSFALRKAVSGIGCVSHHSIVEVRGALYFMSHDGVYALIGSASGGAVKVSKPIDSFWSGRYQSSHVSSSYSSQISNIEWPFEVDAKALDLCQGMHVRSMNQIWWGVPKRGHGKHTFPVTLVYDYVNQAWSYFYSTLSDDDPKDGCMYSGFTFREGNDESIFISSASGDIMRYGNYCDQVGSTKKGIPVVYDSGRMFTERDDVASIRPLRFKVWSRAKSSTNPPQFFVEGEEAHWDIEVNGDPLSAANRQASSGDLPLHPDTNNQYFWDHAAWSGASAVNLAASSVVSGSWRLTTATDHNLEVGGVGIKVTIASHTATDSDGAVVSPNPLNGLRLVTVLSTTILQVEDAVTATAGDVGTGGTITASSTTWTDRDWFSAKVECGTMRSRSFRFGFVDNNTTGVRDPLVHLQSVSLEYTEGDDR